jgi:hypothetical protein
MIRQKPIRSVLTIALSSFRAINGEAGKESSVKATINSRFEQLTQRLGANKFCARYVMGPSEDMWEIQFEGNEFAMILDYSDQELSFVTFVDSGKVELARLETLFMSG